MVSPRSANLPFANPVSGLRWRTISAQSSRSPPPGVGFPGAGSIPQTIGTVHAGSGRARKVERVLGLAADGARTPGTNLDLPRKPEEIRTRLGEVSRDRLPGQDRRRAARSAHSPASKRAFSPARLQYTVYRGTNLLRQEAIAKTRRAIRGLQIRGRAEGFHHRRRHARGVARHGPRLAAISASAAR